MVSQLFAKIPIYRGIPRAGIRSALRPARSTQKLIDRARRSADSLRGLSTSEFLQRADRLRERVQAGVPLTSKPIVCESFALTTEALRRETSLVYYDVQLQAGFALAANTVAEVQTGEGKTITTALPAVLFSLPGKGVHVATTTDYLSARDFEELQPVYERLGISVGLLTPESSDEEKRRAYACDITYGPGYEFGFDFLRDQLTIRSRVPKPLGHRFLESLRGLRDEEQKLLQRGHAYSIVDEADSVLIDEAATPLILSGARSTLSANAEIYWHARDTALSLTEVSDFTCDPKTRRIKLTQSGQQSAYAAFQDRPDGMLARSWTAMIENALRAELLLSEDVDYVCRDGKVEIVDQNTGRIHDERTWSSGLHQAVEAKESLDLTPENETQARVTRQRLAGFYSGICGLTGTAAGSAHELDEFYRLPVVVIPTHRPCLRKEFPVLSFADRESKQRAVVDSVESQRSLDRPVLVGTKSIGESKQISRLLSASGVEHVTLNGLQDEEEANIVSRAGQAGTVTVATNMAGRGTDIKLDSKARDAGGLHVISTEISPSVRVERQLAGRAARQGDAGSFQRFVSADDELIQTHAPGLARRMCASNQESGTRDFSREIRQLQAIVERRALLDRRAMVEQDKWLESIQHALARRA